MQGKFTATVYTECIEHEIDNIECEICDAISAKYPNSAIKIAFEQVKKNDSFGQKFFQYKNSDMYDELIKNNMGAIK